MIYTILDNLLPAKNTYEDLFETSSFLANGTEVTQIDTGMFVVPATVKNRWSWQNLTTGESNVSASGNTLYLEYENDGTGYSRLFNVTDQTAVHGIFPTTFYLNGFSSTCEVTCNFNSLEFPTYNPISAFNHIYESGIFVVVNSVYYITLRIQYNGTANETNMIGYLFHTGTSYTRYQSVTLPSGTSFANVDFKITYKNTYIPTLQYSFDNGDSWNNLSFGVVPILGPITTNFTNTVQCGLFATIDFDTNVNPSNINFKFKDFKIEGFNYDDVTSKLEDYNVPVQDGFFYTQDNIFYLDTDTDTEGNERTFIRQQRPTAATNVNMSGILYTTYDLQTLKQGVYCNFKLRESTPYGGGMLLYVDPAHLPSDNPAIAGINYIYAFLMVLPDLRVNLVVYKCVNSFRTVEYSIILDDVTAADTIELGMGYDAYDSSFWVWSNETQVLINIKDTVFITGNTRVGFTAQSETYFYDCSSVKLEARQYTSLFNQYTLSCSNTADVKALQQVIQDTVQNFEDSVTSMTNALTSANTEFQTAVSTSAELITELNGDMTTIEEHTDDDIVAALSNAGIEITNGVPLLSGTFDLTGYRKLYSLFEDWSYISDLVSSSVNFIFVVTENIYDVSDNVITACNTLNVDEEVQRNTACNVAKTDLITDNTNLTIIGEKVIGVNKVITTLNFISMYDLNFYIFWIGETKSDAITVNRLKNFGLPNELVYKAITNESDPDHYFTVYVLPYMFFSYIADIWGNLSDEEAQDLVVNSEIPSIFIPETIDDVFEALNYFVENEPDYGLDIYKDIKEPSYDPDPTLAEITEGDDTDYCDLIVRALQSMSSGLSTMIDFMNNNVSPIVSDLVKNWKLLSSVVLVTQKALGTTYNLNLPNVAATIDTLKSQVTNAINTFMGIMSTVTSFVQSGKQVACVYDEVLKLIAAFSDFDEELYTYDDIKGIFTCAEEIILQIQIIADQMKNLLMIFGNILNSIFEALARLQYKLPEFSLTLSELNEKVSCNDFARLILRSIDMLTLQYDYDVSQKALKQGRMDILGDQ